MNASSSSTSPASPRPPRTPPVVPSSVAKLPPSPLKCKSAAPSFATISSSCRWNSATPRDPPPQPSAKSTMGLCPRRCRMETASLSALLLLDLPSSKAEWDAARRTPPSTGPLKPGAIADSVESIAKNLPASESLANLGLASAWLGERRRRRSPRFRFRHGNEKRLRVPLRNRRGQQSGRFPPKFELAATPLRYGPHRQALFLS